MEGRYIHIVADMTGATTLGDNPISAGLYTTYNTSICSLGIMGTRYSRSLPLQETIEIEQGQIETITVPHIISDFLIGTSLSINLR